MTIYPYFPKNAMASEWFTNRDYPSRPGYYEVQGTWIFRPVYKYWDGVMWRTAAGGRPSAFSGCMTGQWRGLAEEYKA